MRGRKRWTSLAWGALVALLCAAIPAADASELDALDLEPGDVVLGPTLVSAVEVDGAEVTVVFTGSPPDGVVDGCDGSFSAVGWREGDVLLVAAYALATADELTEADGCPDVGYAWELALGDVGDTATITSAIDVASGRTIELIR